MKNYDLEPAKKVLEAFFKEIEEVKAFLKNTAPLPALTISDNYYKNYAIKNHSVCRMHGARGGPKTAQGYLLCKKASMKHGLYSYETLQEFKSCRQLMKRMGIR